MLFCSAPLFSQTVIDDSDEEEEETDSLFVPIEDEIAVTDREGNEEVIEFPEAMTYDLDSLLNLYMSRTFLGTPAHLSEGGVCGTSESYPLGDGTVV